MVGVNVGVSLGGRVAVNTGAAVRVTVGIGTERLEHPTSSTQIKRKDFLISGIIASHLRGILSGGL